MILNKFVILSEIKPRCRVCKHSNKSHCTPQTFVSPVSFNWNFPLSSCLLNCFTRWIKLTFLVVKVNLHQCELPCFNFIWKLTDKSEVFETGSVPIINGRVVGLGIFVFNITPVKVSADFVFICQVMKSCKGKIFGQPSSVNKDGGGFVI